MDAFPRRQVDVGKTDGPQCILSAESALVIANETEDTSAIRRAIELDPGFVATVVDADSVHSAVQIMCAIRVGLVVIDVGVLAKDGPGAFQELCDNIRSAPIVLVVEPGAEHVGIEAISRGAQAYLVKGEDDARSILRVLGCAVARNRAEHGLRSSEERLELAFRGSDRGIWDWNLITKTVFFSARWASMLGLEEEEMDAGPNHWMDRVHSDDRSGLEAALNAHLAGERAGFSSEFRMRHSSGEDRWYFAQGMAACDAQGRPVRIAGCLSDINARKVAERQILHDAMHDSLTSLPNRAVFTDRIRLSLARLSRRPDGGFAVLFLDLDRFKQVNDSLGHTVGDRLLVGIARRLEVQVRPQDTVTRLCGDEFAILLAEANEADVAVRVADRVLSALAKPFNISGNEIVVSASIGIAMSSTGYESPESMLHDADVAMYRSKTAGGGRRQIFDREMHKSVVALLEMESELRSAVASGAFVMHYQPIVSLDSNVIVGFEGLVRWQHPERGLVTPTQFLAVAEATGLIVPIGWWVLEQACTQMRSWQELFPSDPPLWIGVNVSSRIFMQPHMIDRLLEILYASRLAPESLRLELTEDVVAANGEAAISVLLELRALGVRLSVDDFGDGFAALKYLDRITFDSVKIDPAFIASVDADNVHDRSTKVVETILTLAGGLGMSVVAEGVERSSQRDSLRRLHCPEAQGYWFSRPVAPEKIESLLAAGPNWQGC